MYHWLRNTISCRDAVKICACADVLSVCFYTHPLFLAECIDVLFACCLCVPESAARRVMEHALLNDESEYEY